MEKNVINLLIFIMLALLVFGCSLSEDGPGFSGETAEQKTFEESPNSLDSTIAGPKIQIKKVEEEFMAYFKAQDAEGVASLYTDNGQLLPPDFNIMQGKEAIQAFWQGGMDSGIASVDLVMQELDVQRRTAIEVGQATLYDPDGGVIAVCKFIVIWKKIGWTWKLHKDIWNYNPAE